MWIARRVSGLVVALVLATPTALLFAQDRPPAEQPCDATCTPPPGGGPTVGPSCLTTQKRNCSSCLLPTYNFPNSPTATYAKYGTMTETRCDSDGRMFTYYVNLPCGWC